MGEGPKDVRPGSIASAGDGTPASPETAVLRAQIEQKRSEISETLDEIQDRLRPRRLVSEATGRAREAAATGMRQARGAATQVASSTRDAANRTVEQAREHPWTAAAAAAGLGAAAWWLATRPAAQDWAEAADELETSEETLYGDFGDEFLFVEADDDGMGPYVKAGAVPAAISALALGWWLWSRSRGRAVDHASVAEDESGWNGGAYGSAGADAGSYRTFADRRWQEDGVDGGGVRRAVADVASRARDIAASAGERTREAAGRAQRELSDRGRDAATRVSGWVDENPLGAGAVALLAGVLVGLAIPESQRERRMMGGARDQLIARAKRAGRDAVGRARETIVQAATGSSRPIGS